MRSIVLKAFFLPRKVLLLKVDPALNSLMKLLSGQRLTRMSKIPFLNSLNFLNKLFSYYYSSIYY